jgi:hypothetical protein
VLHALRNRIFRGYATAAAVDLRAIVGEANRTDTPLVESIPSMISPFEQDLLRRLARDYYDGASLIVDAGAFLGASTNVFAMGLRERGDVDQLRRRDTKPIQSYDLGLCDDFMATCVNEHSNASLKPGDSFLPYLRENIVGTRDLVHLNEGDICQYAPSGPVEIMFLDVCKTADVNRHTVRAFYPHLVPGRSVLIHQDFVHEWLPWIHVTMGALAPYFKFIGTVAWSGVWLNTKPIPAAILDANPYETNTVAELNKFFDRAIAPLTNAGQRLFVEQARARMLAEKGDKSGVMRLLDRLDTEWQALPPSKSETDLIAKWCPNPAAMREFISGRI